MACGTPEKLEDVKLYLKDIFGGKEPPESVVAEVTKKYASIGRSPLKDITIRQAELLEKELKTRGLDAEVRVGMRHWKPKLEETAEQLSGRSAGTCADSWVTLTSRLPSKLPSRSGQNASIGSASSSTSSPFARRPSSCGDARSASMESPTK